MKELATKEDGNEEKHQDESLDDEQRAFIEKNLDLVAKLAGLMEKFYSKRVVEPEQTHDYIYSPFFYPPVVLNMLGDAEGICVSDSELWRTLAMSPEESRWLFLVANERAAEGGGLR